MAARELTSEQRLLGERLRGQFDAGCAEIAASSMTDDEKRDAERHLMWSLTVECVDSVAKGPWAATEYAHHPLKGTDAADDDAGAGYDENVTPFIGGFVGEDDGGDVVLGSTVSRGYSPEFVEAVRADVLAREQGRVELIRSRSHRDYRNAVSKASAARPARRGRESRPQVARVATVASQHGPPDDDRPRSSDDEDPSDQHVVRAGTR